MEGDNKGSLDWLLLSVFNVPLKLSAGSFSTSSREDSLLCFISIVLNGMNILRTLSIQWVMQRAEE